MDGNAERKSKEGGDMETVLAIPKVEEKKSQKRERGSGRIWQIGRIWYVQYYSRGRQIRESSHSEVKMVAEKLLQRRLEEARVGATPAVKIEQIRYEHLREAMYADYQVNRRKSLMHHADGSSYICGVSELDSFFARYKAVHITTDRIRAFVTKRQSEGAPNSTINRSLAALRRMFSLAIHDAKLKDAPFIPMLKEPPARRGFLEFADFQKLRAELPEYLRPVLTFGFYTGMRLGEIKGLSWANVDFFEKEIRLEAGTTKNDEPRTVPLIGELPEMLQILRQQNQDCSTVFSLMGRPIGNIRKSWTRACVRAGLGRFLCPVCESTLDENHRCLNCKNRPELPRYEGLIFHDLRRTGVRNLVRAGVPERVAMAISGHKTRAIFERYNIVSGRDLKEAGRKLETYIAQQKGANSSKLGQDNSDVRDEVAKAIH
jgi:integrase